MKLAPTPLDQPTKNRLINHYTEQAVKQNITPERALYNSSKIMGHTAEHVDTLYSMPAGSTATWIKANDLPTLSGKPDYKTAAEILAGK